jgi:hypothetical protein
VKRLYSSAVLLQTKELQYYFGFQLKNYRGEEVEEYNIKFKEN